MCDRQGGVNRHGQFLAAALPEFGDAETATTATNAGFGTLNTTTIAPDKWHLRLNEVLARLPAYQRPV